MIDWTYLRDRDKKALAEEKNYLDLQQVKVIVDISGGFNHFPDLRLVKNDPPETRRTDDAVIDVLEKMHIIGSRDLLIALGRYPETNMTREDADRSIRERLAEYSDLAAKYGVKLHLRQSSKRLNHEPQICRKYLADGKIAFAPSLAAMPSAILWMAVPSEAMPFAMSREAEASFAMPLAMSRTAVASFATEFAMERADAGSQEARFFRLLAVTSEARTSPPVNSEPVMVEFWMVESFMRPPSMGPSSPQDMRSSYAKYAP
jgi:hypothetical protein